MADSSGGDWLAEFEAAWGLVLSRECKEGHPRQRAVTKINVVDGGRRLMLTCLLCRRERERQVREKERALARAAKEGRKLADEGPQVSHIAGARADADLALEELRAWVAEARASGAAWEK